MSKAVFEAQDLGPGLDLTKTASPKKYSGPERRLNLRRTALDRRNEIRFSMRGGDRRNSQGRRHDDLTVSPW